MLEIHAVQSTFTLTECLDTYCSLGYSDYLWFKEIKVKYKKIFNLIDTNIFLQVPSFKHVYKWRLLQEKKLRLSSKGKKIMTKSQVKEFIMFYERLTKHMLKSFNKKAECVIRIDEKHKLKSIKFN